MNSPAKTIGFDSRAVTVNDRRVLLISGEMHYARSPRELWPALLDRSVEAGLNCIGTYVFWNIHEPRRDVYDFSGDRDIGYYLKLCGERGLYAILRLGPYCCAEWNFGAFPPYLRDEPGITIRTWNEPYLKRVEKYFSHLMAEVRPHLAGRGGPVILVQVENEYANVAKRYGEEGQRYLAWMVDLARSMGVDVPTITCEGGAPGAIECVNGFMIGSERIEKQVREYPDMPLIWTELWPSWYDTWGFQHHRRDPQNIAFWLLDFIAHGGSGWNYYMWHGGTNFGRSAMYLQTTSYDFDAPLDEWGGLTLKGAYLKRLHKILQDHAPLLLQGERVTEIVEPGRTRTTWRYQDRMMTLVADHDDRSARLLDAAGKVLFDTTRALTSVQRAFPVLPWKNLPPLRNWRSWNEPFPDHRENAVRAAQPVEQLALTADASDYCWYSTKIEVKRPGRQELEIPFGGDFFYVFCDGRLVAQSLPPFRENRGPTLPAADTGVAVNPLETVNSDGFRHEFTFDARPGVRRLDILAVSLGLIKGDWQIAGSMNTERKGIWAEVRLGGRVLRNWQMRPFLAGEQLRLVESTPGVPWRRLGAPRACSWYSTSFTIPRALLEEGADFRLDGVGLGKGMLFVNGRMAGRHWLIEANGYGADEHWHDMKRCGLSIDPAGRPTQRYYHIPRAWLKSENRLVIFEEQACHPTEVRLQVRRGSR